MVQGRVGRKAVQAAQKTPPRPQYLRTTLIQLMLLFFGAPITYLVGGLSSAVSLASGAMCALLPQAYFAVRVAAASRHSAQQAARLGLSAEGGKFVLSAVSFALVFAVLKPERPGLVFIGFGLFWTIQIIEGIRLLRHSR
ncbi:ATP synthase subunit I [Congregibacter sp.]|jgi:ATP synthase protein I|uniref:ATP synthase subunit I n=1 Tax=Congregibacter sp. TaxID=2744308 RepID=UPI0039E54AF8